MHQSFYFIKALRPTLASLASGFFLAASATVPGAAVSFFVGVVLFFISVRITKTLLWASMQGWLAGTLYMAAAFFWIVQLHPLTWMGVASTTWSLVFVFGIWVGVSILTGSLFAGLALLIRVQRTSSSLFFCGLVFASAWVLMEKVRAFVLAIVSYGPAASLVPHHSYSDAGYVVSQLHFFSWLLPFGGVSLSSFFAVFVAWLLYYALERQRTWAALLIVLFLIAGNYVLPAPNESYKGTPTTVGVVTTSFEPDFSKSALSNRKASIEQLLEKQTSPVDSMVLPENSFYLYEKGIFSTSSVSRLGPGATVLIDSFPSANEHTLYYFRPDSGEVKEYKKMVLMPQGEYPMWWMVLGARLFEPSWLVRNSGLLHAKKGKALVTFEVAPGLTLGSLLCSELGSPYLYRSLAKRGATLLINPASHSVFHGSSLLKFQTRIIAQARAMELGRYVVVAGNSTDSLVISPRGTLVLNQSPGKDSLSLAVVSAESIKKQTLYTKMGEWVVCLSLFIVMIYLIQVRKRISK